MKHQFDTLVNNILNEAFDSNSYTSDEPVECPYKLQDSLREKGIEIDDDQASEMYDKFRGKPFGDVEREINMARSKSVATPTTPTSQTTPQRTQYSQNNVNPREQTKY